VAEDAAKERETIAVKKRGKLERIVGRQMEASEKLLSKRAEGRGRGDAIYRHFGLADEIVRGISGARERGFPGRR